MVSIGRNLTNLGLVVIAVNSSVPKMLTKLVSTIIMVATNFGQTIPFKLQHFQICTILTSIVI